MPIRPRLHQLITGGTFVRCQVILREPDQVFGCVNFEGVEPGAGNNVPFPIRINVIVSLRPIGREPWRTGFERIIYE